MIVYVVSFAPNVTENGGVGGFEWRREFTHAKGYLENMLNNPHGANAYDYRLTAVDVGDRRPDQITDYLDGLELL